MEKLPIAYEEKGYLTTYRCKCGLQTLSYNKCSECSLLEDLDRERLKRSDAEMQSESPTNANT